MEVKVYDYLQEDAMNIRRNVFMSEQGYKNEFDEIDDRALHIVIYNNKKESLKFTLKLEKIIHIFLEELR